MKTCPDCHTARPDAVMACACGYSWQAAAPATSRGSPIDPDHGRCATEILGKRCPNIGTWSSTPQGKRYCPSCRDGLRTIQAAEHQAPPEVFEKLRAMLKPGRGPRRIGEPATPPTSTGSLLPAGSLRGCLTRTDCDERDSLPGPECRVDVDAWGEGRE